MWKAFLSYRRSDVLLASLALTLLRGQEPELEVFLDTADLEPGPWPPQLREALSSSDVVLVLIGPGWIDAIPRLREPADVLRQELAHALSRNAPILPTLGSEVSMPRADQLPAEVQELTRFQAHALGLPMVEAVKRTLAGLQSERDRSTQLLEELEADARAHAGDPPGPPKPILASGPEWGQWESTFHHPNGKSSELLFEMREGGAVEGTWAGPPSGLLRRRRRERFVGRSLVRFVPGTTTPGAVLVEGQAGPMPISFEISYDFDRKLGDHYVTQLRDGTRVLSRVLRDLGRSRV